MGKFDGKIVVVTGAGQGLGFSISEKFVKEGAKVILTGRTMKKLEDAAAKIGSPNAVPFHMDCSAEEDWVKLVEYIKTNYDEMDVLVNNAGIILGKSVLDMSFEEFKMTERCNLDSVFLGTKYCYQVLKKGVYSSIVNISSAGAMKAGPDTGNDAGYHATKAAVRHFTKHCAYALAPDMIRVNSVHPGGINTDMSKAIMEENPQQREMLPLICPLAPHISEPEDIANAVLFLADSTLAKPITGAELVVDCGLLTK